MLDSIYMEVLDMSKTASIVILVVILARLLLKKAPKVFSYALWVVVLFRLLCPVTFEAPVSIVPEMSSVSQGYTLSEESISVFGAGEAAYQAIGDALNGGLGIQHIRTTEKTETGMTKYVTTDWWSVWILFGQYVWMAGVAGMLIYSAVSYLKIRKKLSVIVPLRDNIFIADDIKSPFVVGLFRPRIYLPCNLGDKEQEYIILHEQHHIKRLDHIMKALAFLALAIHWFNPLVWVAFILAGKDMEMSCDEAVIRKAGGDIRADYSASLLTLATGRRIIAGTPLAFGEGDTKGRIRNLANWRKPAFWVVLVAVAACVVLAVCLLTNPNSSSRVLKYSYTSYLSGSQQTKVMQAYNLEKKALSVTVNFETTEGPVMIELAYGHKKNGADNEWIYNEPVSMALGESRTFTVPADHHFTFTATSLDGANGNVMFVFTESKSTENQLNNSDEVTPDKITFEAEVLEAHDGYFLVKPEPSWAINSADQIEVPMKNMDPALEPQVGDIIEISYSGEILETYPVRLKEVYGIRVIAETTKLTLDDVIILSRYGYDLSWSDFENYDYIETGSGLYIRVYEINEMYKLWIGGAGPDRDPMYIYLALADDLDTRIDIRDGGVEEFIAADHSEVLLTNAIHDAILEANKPSKPDGLYHCASFALLSLETVSGTPLAGATNHMETVTVYGLALHQGYGFSGHTFHEAAGSHIPVAITFDVVDGKYVLKDYWTPRDGSYYVEDIRNKFPDEIEDEALDTQKYIRAQIQTCYDKAVRYGGVATDYAVEYLFEVIESSPVASSRPAAYIDAHPIEYQELLYYGNYTLRYVFSEFLKGSQTGLRGHLMREVLDDLAPEAQLRLYAETGQEYFDEWKAAAIRVGEQHDAEWIKANQPAIGLLLQMLNE